VADLDTALDERLLDVAVGQAVAQVSADRDHDHLRRKPEPGERRPRRHPRQLPGSELRRLAIEERVVLPSR
jgi:hypothetical protein